MKELLELMDVISKRRQRRSDRFDEFDEEGNRTLLHKFYNGLKEGKYQSDEDAARDLYDIDPAQKKYQMLKSRLKERLLNKVLLLEEHPGNKISYHNARTYCNKNLLIAKNLIDRGALKTATKLLDKILTISQRYQFTEITLESAKILSNITVKRKTKFTFDYYVQIMNKALKALNAETETNPIYVMLSKKFTKNITRSPELIAKTEEEVVRIKDMLKEVDSHTLRLNYYRILLYLNQTKNDHQETIKICEDVDKYYRENPHLAVDSVLSSFALTKQKSYLLLRDYENANNYTHLIESFFASGRQSWFTFQKNCFLIALNSEDYAKADAIFKQVVTNPSFKRSGDDNKDRWMLFGCYLTFLNKAGQYTSTIMDLKFFKKYNIQRLLRKIPKYSKEHLGHNLSMLTVQFLMLLFEGHRDRMTQRKEALSFYLEKFQTNRKHLRSNLMIRMIYIMIQNKFELEKTHNQTARYYKTLLPSSKNPGIMDNNEVVFYDKLWEIALLKVEEQQRERIMKKMNLKPDTNE